jgi:hypothetical protein
VWAHSWHELYVRAVSICPDGYSAVRCPVLLSGVTTGPVTGVWGWAGPATIFAAATIDMVHCASCLCADLSNTALCTCPLHSWPHLNMTVPVFAAVPFVLAIGLAFGKAVGAPEGFGMLTSKWCTALTASPFLTILLLIAYGSVNVSLTVDACLVPHALA